MAFAPPLTNFCCGSGRIRTYGGLTTPTVFKTAALNHSATPPHEAVCITTNGFNYAFIFLRLQYVKELF